MKTTLLYGLLVILFVFLSILVWNMTRSMGRSQLNSQNSMHGNNQLDIDDLITCVSNYDPIIFEKKDSLFSILTPKECHEEVLKLLDHLTSETKDFETTKAPKSKEEIKIRQNIDNFPFKRVFAERLRSDLSAILVSNELFDPENDITPLIDKLLLEEDFSRLKLIEKVFAEMGKKFSKEPHYIDYIAINLERKNGELAYTVIFCLLTYAENQTLLQYQQNLPYINSLQKSIDSDEIIYFTKTSDEQKIWYKDQLVYYIDKLNRIISGEEDIKDYSHQTIIR